MKTGVALFCHTGYNLGNFVASLTLPALEERGFLDLRAALNLRILAAIPKPKPRQD
ncbi:MAG: hypothetical protein F6K65_34735 [Moorea sp. SIO3C2]|nr:hypothetical protein [Moorena sp. SIO3C2]